MLFVYCHTRICVSPGTGKAGRAVVDVSGVTTTEAPQNDADKRRRLAPNQTMMAKRMRAGRIGNFAPLSLIGLAVNVVVVECGLRVCH